MGNRLLFAEFIKTVNLLVPKIETGVSLSLIVIYFLNSKTISQLNLERLLVMDFCSNDFSEIPLKFLWHIISIKAHTRNFSKKYQQNFLLEAIFFEQ